MSEVQITVSEDGPYVVTGPITIVDPAGTPIEIIGKRAFLCRCGASSNKPFCDGSHASIGFQGALAGKS
jgi:CDGSH iron-sulfur domain-containing protein 3